MEKKHVHNSFEKYLLDFFFSIFLYAQNCLRPSYNKEKIPYDTMDSKIKLLHVITGLINKGKQKQKPKWTEKLRIDWSCHFFYSSMGCAKL